MMNHEASHHKEYACFDGGHQLTTNKQMFLQLNMFFSASVRKQSSEMVQKLVVAGVNETFKTSSQGVYL